jgi:hypothetical protein
MMMMMMMMMMMTMMMMMMDECFDLWCSQRRLAYWEVTTQTSNGTVIA